MSGTQEKRGDASMKGFVVRIVPAELPDFHTLADLRAFCSTVLIDGSPRGGNTVRPAHRNLMQALCGFVHFFPPYRSRQNLGEVLLLLDEIDAPVTPDMSHMDYLMSEYSIWLGGDGVPKEAALVLTWWSDFRAQTARSELAVPEARRVIGGAIRRFMRLYGFDPDDAVTVGCATDLICPR